MAKHKHWIHQKGPRFEREFAKELSLWWTKRRRDDVFYRTGGSGGRAFNRSRRGQSTHNQYGDIAATDLIGQPLLQLFTIECKRGYSTKTIADLLDRRCTTKGLHPFEVWIQKASRDSCHAGVPYWMLVVQRNKQQPIVYLPQIFLDKLEEIFYKEANSNPIYFTWPFLTIEVDLRFKTPEGHTRTYRERITAITWDNFSDNITPGIISHMAWKLRN